MQEKIWRIKQIPVCKSPTDPVHVGFQFITNLWNIRRTDLHFGGLSGLSFIEPSSFKDQIQFLFALSDFQKASVIST